MSKDTPKARPPVKGEASSLREQATDADFLVENFGMVERDAAGLVARDGVPADEVEAQTRALQKQHDPLAGIPVPKAPKDELVPDSDEKRLKPVLHRRNDRTGGG